MEPRQLRCFVGAGEAGSLLADSGKVLLKHTQVVLADMERVRMAVRETSAVPGGGDVIGLPTAVALVATVRILHTSRERYPRGRLKLVEADSGHLRE